jgi:hypothetical protein
LLFSILFAAGVALNVLERWLVLRFLLAKDNRRNPLVLI